MSRAVLIMVVSVLAPAAGAWGADGDSGVRDASGGIRADQTEQSIAVAPSDPRNVLVGALTQGVVDGHPLPGNVSVSHDGGMSWKVVRVDASVCGDQSVAFDRVGTGYYLCDGTDGVHFARSADGGEHWSTPVTVVTPMENYGDGIDRPWFATDNGGGPRAGTVYIGWESFFTNPNGWVLVRSSRDSGRTWGPVTRVDDPNEPAMQDPRQYPVVGADGTLYVVYARSQNGLLTPESPAALVVARSADGGATFRRVTAATGIRRTSAPQEEQEVISSLAADPARDRAGHLALAWADMRSGESRILVATSVDGGATWSRPLDVADDPPNRDNEHDHPQAGFLPDGRLVVVWRDRRCCGGASNSSFEIFARAFEVAQSGALIAGVTARVAATPQAPRLVPLFDEYLGAATGPEGVSIAWNQIHDGVSGSVFRRLPVSTFGASRAATCRRRASARRRAP